MKLKMKSVITLVLVVAIVLMFNVSAFAATYTTTTTYTKTDGTMKISVASQATGLTAGTKVTYFAYKGTTDNVVYVDQQDNVGTTADFGYTTDTDNINATILFGGSDKATSEESQMGGYTLAVDVLKDGESVATTSARVNEQQGEFEDDDIIPRNVAYAVPSGCSVESIAFNSGSGDDVAITNYVVKENSIVVYSPVITSNGTLKITLKGNTSPIIYLGSVWNQATQYNALAKVKADTNEYGILVSTTAFTTDTFDLTSVTSADAFTGTLTSGVIKFKAIGKSSDGSFMVQVDDDTLFASGTPYYVASYVVTEGNNAAICHSKNKNDDSVKGFNIQ